MAACKCVCVLNTGQIYDDKGGGGCHCIYVHLFILDLQIM